MAKLLLVDDDAGLLIELRDWLRFEKHVVDTASDGESAKNLIFYSDYDVIILDWDLGSHSGVEILKEARQRGVKTAVIMLTGKGELSDKMLGLDSGADSYVVKPAEPAEVSALVRALLRRYESRAPLSVIADLEVDSAARVVRCGTNDLKLTKLEFECLIFLTNCPRPISIEAILRRVWSNEGSVPTVRQHLSQLRAKLVAGGSRLRVEHHKGVGYHLVDPSSGSRPSG